MTEQDRLIASIKQIAANQIAEGKMFEYNITCSADSENIDVDIFYVPEAPVQWVSMSAVISPEGPKRVKWRKLEGKRRTLECSLHYENNPEIFTPSGLRDEHLDPILVWCRDNNCGYRTSYTHFAFDTDEQMTMFLLRWA